MTIGAFSGPRGIKRIGGITGGGGVATDTIAGLIAVDTAGLVDGTFAWVRSVEDWWVLNRTTALVADGITVVNAAVGGGQWIRKKIRSTRWLRQATWFINPTTGDDENTGIASASAIATHAELERRAMSGGATIEQTTTVTIEEDLPVTDPININVAVPNADTAIFYRGTATTVVGGTGTITARTAINPALQTPPDITDAAQNFGTLPVPAGKIPRLRLTSGANIGAITWFAIRVAGLGAANRTFNWASLSATVVPIIGPLTSNITPGIGDSYVVETLTRVLIGNVCVVITDPGGTTVDALSNLGIMFDSLEVGRFSLTTNESESRVEGAAFRACAFQSQIFADSTMTMVMCVKDNFVSFDSCMITMSACGIASQGIIAYECNFIFSDNTGAQGFGIFAPAFLAAVPFMMGNNIVVLGTASRGLYSFDSSHSGLIVDSNTGLRIIGIVWGDNNTTYGIETDARVVYAAIQPTITGLTNDTRIGATDTAYAAVPFFDGGAAASGAGIVTLDIL